MKDGKPYVIGIGELLWDVLPDGKKMGGAPANFIYHINHMGIYGDIISSVGNDPDGMELIKLIKQKGIPTDLIDIDSRYPTGTVTVKIDRSGNPEYTIHENIAWDHIHFVKSIEENLRMADAICFGSLAQRNTVSAETIIECLRGVDKDCLRVFDINLRQKFFTPKTIMESLHMADILKINEDEIIVVAEMFDSGKDEMSILKNISEKFNLRLIALTKGADSSILYSKDEISSLKTPEVSVVDTVGAGDSFTAVLVAGLLKGDTLKSIHQKAVDVSAWVCTLPGATPPYTQQIKDILR